MKNYPKVQALRNALVAGLAILLTANASAQSAEIRDGVLIVSEVVTTAGAFHAEFALREDRQPVQIELIASSDISPSGSFLAASFNEDLLTIPEVRVGKDRYWIEFEHLGNNRFELLDYGSWPARHHKATGSFPISWTGVRCTAMPTMLQLVPMVQSG